MLSQRVAMVPPILLALIRSPLFKKYSLRTLQKTATGAAPLGPDLQREASKALNCNVTQVWGMSETTGVSAHIASTLDGFMLIEAKHCRSRRTPRHSRVQH